MAIVIETNILRSFGIIGIALFPFVFVVDKKNKKLMQHELIHIEQQKELFVLPFYILYLWEYFRVGYKKSKFEREAKLNERLKGYLDNRPKYNWKKYKV